MRCAYAIEYDCVDPLQMAATLEFMDYPGLYGAGQFNGSSGYEEAAAQGLVAGMNAALKIKGREQVVLDRASSYIGTLIDDLVTKGVEDPYRMMTSRSEYRLVLRQDNADERLTPLGREIGLISDSRWNRFVEKQELKRKELNRLKKTSLPPTKELNEILVSRETSPVETGIRLLELLKRPQVDYACLARWIPPGRIWTRTFLNRWKWKLNMRAISGGRNPRLMKCAVWKGSVCQRSSIIRKSTEFPPRPRKS